MTAAVERIDRAVGAARSSRPGPGGYRGRGAESKGCCEDYAHYSASHEVAPHCADRAKDHWGDYHGRMSTVFAAIAPLARRVPLTVTFTPSWRLEALAAAFLTL